MDSDAAVGAELMATDPTIGEDDIEVLGDSAYATGDMPPAQPEAVNAAAQPWPMRPAVQGGFTIDDFTHDMAAQTLTCPAGVTRQITAKNNASSVRPAIDARWPNSAQPRPGAELWCSVSTTSCNASTANELLMRASSSTTFRPPPRAKPSPR